MEISKLSDKMLMLLLEIDKRGSVTSKTQSIYLSFAFYLNIGTLEERGLVFCDGINKENQKIWKLTQKGKKFVEYLKSIEGVLSA